MRKAGVLISGRGTAAERPGHTISFARAGRRRAPRFEPNSEERARELVVMAAHDLRSPLSAIKMRAEGIVRRWRAGDTPAGAEWASVVLGISRAANGAFSLIDDVLAV